MSSLLRLSKVGSGIADQERTGFDVIKDVIEVASKHPALIGVVLVIAGSFVKRTRVPAHKETRTVYVAPDIPFGAFPTSEEATGRYETISVDVGEYEGLDFTVTGVDVGQLLDTVMAPVAAFGAGFIPPVSTIGETVRKQAGVPSDRNVMRLTFGDLLTLAGVFLLAEPLFKGAIGALKV